MYKPARRGTRAALGGLILGTVLTALTLTACGLFDIRDPVEPRNIVTGPCAGQIPAGSDAVVLENFTVAMKCGVDGLALYDDTLGDKFALELDPLDAADFQGRDTLSRAEDYQAHETIVNNIADSLYFAFELVQPTRGDTEALYEDMPYTLEVVDQQEDTSIVVQTYSGTVDLTVVEAGAGEWVMQRWKDQGDQSGNPTLGAFHATYALEQPGSAGRRYMVN